MYSWVDIVGDHISVYDKKEYIIFSYPCNNYHKVLILKENIVAIEVKLTNGAYAEDNCEEKIYSLYDIKIDILGTRTYTFKNVLAESDELGRIYLKI